MRPALARATAAASLAVLAGSAAACSSTATTTTPPATNAATTTSAATTPGSTAGTTVKVDMVEWEVQPSAASAPAGAITFEVTNKGTKTHELVLFKTDLAPDKLPLDEEGAVDERGAGVELVDEVEDVEAGSTKSFTVADVSAGNYLLVCNLVEDGDKHFGHAMYKAFTVS